MPPAVPMARTRAQAFDDMVLEAVENLERSIGENDRIGPSRLAIVEFAVEDVPGDINTFDADVLEDHDVPLARLVNPSGSTSTPRIVVYRRPLELRAQGDDLADLVRSVIIEQVANLLGVRPDEIDPEA